jgi:FAD/FMN-containing dehydrogenase
MDRHASLVAEISATVQRFYRQRVPFRISHGSTNSTRHAVRRQNVVNTARLDSVLEIDRAKKVVLVEPNVPMDRLVQSTLQHGLVPPVVMEFPGITVGGGYAGTAGESSSFRHGYFDKTINWVEMVLGNGDVVKASPEQNVDLFNGAAGALGTLGVTTLIELRLIEAKRYVRATYHPVKTTTEALNMIRSLQNDPAVDYIDGVIYSPSEAVVISGSMVEDADPNEHIQTFSGAWDPWFYLHVRDIVHRSKKAATEIIPLAEYLFRYDRGGFWVGASAFNYWRFPFNKYTRWFLDDFLHTRMLYRALHGSNQPYRYVVQDLAMPYESAAEFVDFAHEKFGIYPLWLCPLKEGRVPTFHPHNRKTKSDQVINVGLWGASSGDRHEFIRKNRSLETKLKELGGMKWLYAQAFYTKQEFWETYDKEWYDRLREKYHATYLPTVYDKVNTEVKNGQPRSWISFILQIWPLPGIIGLLKSMNSGDWRIPRTTNAAIMTMNSKPKEL